MNGFFLIVAIVLGVLAGGTLFIGIAAYLAGNVYRGLTTGNLQLAFTDGIVLLGFLALVMFGLSQTFKVEQ